MNLKIRKIIREEIEKDEREENAEEISLSDLPNETDPVSGVVAPSKKVISDICEKEKFCSEQGPITFGQLRSIVEEAQRKNLIFDIGEGFYKATLRLFPWFFPQIAIAGFIGSSVRAFNKIVRPGLEDTRGYKSWWGKTMMMVMDTFEGDIPRRDPISKIFFISDGLLHMMDKKFKLKFARYIAELATSKPDSEPVPEYFVENELRKWINQKFLLNPPLQPKTMNESKDEFDWIRDTQPISYEYLLGKALQFEPPIKDGNTLMSILNFLTNLGFEHGDWYLDTDWDYELIVGLYINPSGRIIWTGELDGENYQYHINYYANEDVEVLDGWDTLSGYINRGTITESEDDTWNWVRDIEVKTDLTPAQIYNRYEVFPVEVVGPYIAGQYRDIEHRSGKLYFITDGWCDLVRLFEDNSGGYNYMNRHLATAIFCDDDYWEPYSASDLIGRDWRGNVWDVVTDVPEALEYVKNYIKKHYVVPVGYSYDPNQLELFDEPSKKLDVFEIDGRVLDTEFFDEIIQDNNYLGDLIDDEEIFEELKRELGWAYAGAYNIAASNNVYNSATDAIIDLLGKPTWEGDNLVFECTDLILDTVKELISSCLSDHRRYYDPEKHKEEDQTDEEAFEAYAEECIDKPFDHFSWFVDVFVDFLEENDDELNPHYDDYASNSEIKENLLEEIYSRF